LQVVLSEEGRGMCLCVCVRVVGSVMSETRDS
jgi:hypothetical protein